MIIPRKPVYYYTTKDGAERGKKFWKQRGISAVIKPAGPGLYKLKVEKSRTKRLHKIHPWNI